jgi:O-antigen/teichoic acid export membrane protein
MAAANAVASLFTLLYQVSMAKLLPEAEFGTLASLLAFLVILSVVAPAFQLSAAKYAAMAHASGTREGLRLLWSSLLKWAFGIGFVASTVAFLLMPVISWLLQIESAYLLSLLAVSFLFAFAHPVNMGILQGLHRYRDLAAVLIATPLTRLILGSILVMLGLGVFGAFLPYSVGFIIVFAATLLPMRRLPRGEHDAAQTRSIITYMTWTTLAYGSFIILTNVDVVLAKHYLDPQSAGQYAALSVLGKIILFAPVGVTFVLFAEVAGTSRSNQRRHILFAASLAYVIAACGAVLLIYGLLPDRVISFLVGEQYQVIANSLVRYGAGSLGLALTSLMMHYYLAVNRTKVAFPIIAAILLQILMVAFFHDQVEALADIRLLTGTFSMVAMGVYGFFPASSTLRQLVRFRRGRM